MGHLATIPSPVSVEFVTLVCSYLVQALGVGMFLACSQRRPALVGARACACFAGLYVLVLVPAMLSRSLVVVLLAGAIINLLCGIVQAFYLSCIAGSVEKNRRGTVFGVGYSMTTLAGWALDKFAGGVLMQGVFGLVVCGALAALATLLMLKSPAVTTTDQGSSQPLQGNNVVLLACLLVVLVSLINNLGYGFPHADVLEGVDLTASRLFYGAGLVVAGIASDRNRAYGMLCCACSLVVPLASLALAGARVPATALWAIGYLLSGFFSVFRVTLLADLSANMGHPELSGAGLMFGRVGDALGTAICLALSPNPIVLISLTCAFFAVTLPLFYVFQQRMEQQADEETAVQESPSKQELFEGFASCHELSERQQEVLRLMLDGQTNQQIASKLVVSENTVKFHVRNVLKKTGCKNRAELRTAWAAHLSQNGVGNTAGQGHIARNHTTNTLESTY